MSKRGGEKSITHGKRIQTFWLMRKHIISGDIRNSLFKFILQPQTWDDDHIFQFGGSTTNQIWESTNYPIKGHVYSNGIGLQHVPRNKGTPKAQNTDFIGTHVSLQANEFQLEVGNVPNEIGTGMETSTYHPVIKDGFPENHFFSSRFSH